MLRVWLPLNEDLRNQGLSNVTVTNNGATFNENGGKLGGCYLFDGSDDFINLGNSINSIIIGSSHPFSISFWIKSLENGTRAALFSSYSLPSASTFFSLEINSGSKTDNSLRFDWLGEDIKYFTGVVTYNEWIHLTVTYDGNTIKCYKNGILFDSITKTLNTLTSENNYYLGRDARTGATAFNGFMNDFRIYDHCLSTMEVKQISQGLVLHYPLSGIGGENLLAGTNNGAVNWQWTMQVGDFTKAEETTLSGVKGCKFTRGSTAQSGWSVIYYSVVDESVFESSTNYTLSVDIYPSVATSFIVSVRQTNGTNAFTTNSDAQSVVPNKWNRIVFHLTTVSTLPSSTEEVIYFQNMNSGTGVSYIFRNLKLEKGSVATPWCPNKNDELYSTMGFDDGIEYDTSGFQNNGTQTGTITWNSDSARYNSCYEMTGTSYINCGKPYDYIIDGSEEFTVNMWAYKDTWDTSTQIYSCTESGGFSLSTGNNSVTCYCHVYGASSVLTNSSGETITNSKGDPILLSTSASYITFTQSHTLSSGWHMFTMVYTKKGLKLYVDGNLIKNATSSSIGVHYNKNCNLFIGAEATGSGGCSGPYLNGKASDFRVFAKALDDTDILALYKLGGSLDSNGVFHTYEYVEG